MKKQAKEPENPWSAVFDTIREDIDLFDLDGTPRLPKALIPDENPLDSDFEIAKKALRDLWERDNALKREESQRKRLAEWRGQLTNAEEAKAQAMLLNELYGVDVIILSSDREYHAEETLLRTIKEKAYFITEESPIETCVATERSIRLDRLRTGIRNEKRIEKATENKQGLAAEIETIQEDFMKNNKGRRLSDNKIASILNERGTSTPRGGNTKWYGETVKRVRASKDEHLRG